jgi:hypothetical protein
MYLLIHDRSEAIRTFDRQKNSTFMGRERSRRFHGHIREKNRQQTSSDRDRTTRNRNRSLSQVTNRFTSLGEVQHPIDDGLPSRDCVPHLSIRIDHPYRPPRVTSVRFSLDESKTAQKRVARGSLNLSYSAVIRGAVNVGWPPGTIGTISEAGGPS